jgi:hypothetical protein
MGKPYFSRRDFLRRSVLGAGALALPNIIARKSWAEGPREDALKRLTVGVIGVGGRGRDDMRAFLAQRDTQVVAVCDCYADRRQQAVDMVNQAYGNEDCKQYIDMMELLARPDIDAVLIATGDNWHSGVSILAARAGKDIYCEKPLSVCLSESRAVADTMKRLGRVFQCGTPAPQHRAFPLCGPPRAERQARGVERTARGGGGRLHHPRRAHPPRPAGARA